ncbi:hypothetical protein [Amycolatopsis rhizosphaerae]|nr:hypothetical protein [Amycolatopsis rhizosphaerae]
MSEEVQPDIRVLAPMRARTALSGAQLKVLAASGGFAVDETTGDQMIQALEGVVDTLNARWSALQRLGEAPPMSTTATAQWVSNHMQSTGTDERGLLTQLQHARAELPEYIEAIKLAKRNYRSRDEETQHTLTQLRTEV